MTLLNPATLALATRPLSAQEQIGRANAMLSSNTSNSPTCCKTIWISVFFDGTNNNLDRDQKAGSHSNIAVLYNTHLPDTADNDHYPIYIPGVGTAFPQIGELRESADGKSKARGGEARIHYAMIHAYNAVHRATNHNRWLVSADEALNAVRTDRYALDNLNVAWTIGRGKRSTYFSALEDRLKTAIQGKRPEVKQIHLSVFGFSRGAAQARTFSNWLLECCTGKGNNRLFCGIPIRFQFLGIFDTVASVGLADSSPVGRGLMDWADGSLGVSDAIERTVHYVAAHEIRQNFPLSSARNGRTYPPNCVETVFPGAHSDVGGGYAPGEQGKASGGRSHLLSQIPLINMYIEAIKAGVPLMTIPELRAKRLSRTADDLHRDDQLAARFAGYVNWAKVSPKSVEAMTFDHMRLYWRWRLRVAPAFQSLASYSRATPQDKVDMLASNIEFENHIRSIDLHNRMQRDMPTLTRIHDFASLNPAGPNDAEMAAAAERDRINDLPLLVHELFDEHLHDSHASFRLREPLTDQEKQDIINKTKDKERHGKPLTSLERRIIAQDRTSPGSFPVINDTDLSDLKDMGGVVDNAALWIIDATRRESGSIIRKREVLDNS